MSESGNDLASISREAADAATDLTEAPRPLERRRRVTDLARKLAVSGAGAAGRGSRTAHRAARAGAGWLAGQVLEMAPRLRVRNQEELQAEFPGKSPAEIADALIEGAARASAATGAAAGVWSVVPVVTTFPAEVAAETLIVVGIEVKLVAELHEALGMSAEGNSAERMRTYVAAWAHRRGVSTIPGGVVFAAGSPLAQLLRRRLTTRAARSTLSLGPLLTGAAAGAIINGRETRRLGRQVRQDLRRYVIRAPVV